MGHRSKPIYAVLPALPVFGAHLIDRYTSIATFHMGDAVELGSKWYGPGLVHGLPGLKLSINWHIYNYFYYKIFLVLLPI